ncbi:MAG: hypothetical protein COB30_005675 [Ectothiorhodospiraceae bacterium]|nr:hypothetical protein [Ectothiorhodospiraceae bacterium]
MTFLKLDPGGDSAVSNDAQASSSFYWRPEHRPISVSGGVRLAEAKVDGGNSRVSRSFNTNVGVGYRLTRSLNLNASASLGTSDGGGAQTLSTSQVANISYTGGHGRYASFSYSWQWAAGLSNSATRTETSGVSLSTSQQSYNAGIGHNIGSSWRVGRASNISASVSQSVTGSESTEIDGVTSSLTHGASTSWNTRGRRGSTYVSMRLSDSRSYSEEETAYNDFGFNVVSDYTVNRVSSFSGSINFSASQNQLVDDAGEDVTDGSRILNGGLSYRNSRPFGIYNLQFSSKLIGSKQIDSDVPTTAVRIESLFRFSLGLLATTLGARISESAGGVVTKSMNFQATRSF